MDIAQANVLELAPIATRTSTYTGSAVDTVALDGIAQMVLMTGAASAGTDPTLNVKLTECDTSGGTYTDVTGATCAEVTDAADSTQMIAIKASELKRYVKLVGTIGGTATPTFTFGVVLIGANASGRNASQSV